MIGQVNDFVVTVEVANTQGCRVEGRLCVQRSPVIVQLAPITAL